MVFEQILVGGVSQCSRFNPNSCKPQVNQSQNLSVCEHRQSGSCKTVHLVKQIRVNWLQRDVLDALDPIFVAALAPVPITYELTIKEI